MRVDESRIPKGQSYGCDGSSQCSPFLSISSEQSICLESIGGSPHAVAEPLGLFCALQKVDSLEAHISLGPSPLHCSACLNFLSSSLNLKLSKISSQYHLAITLGRSYHSRDVFRGNQTG